MLGSGSSSGADAEVLARVLQGGFGANPIPALAAVGGAEPGVPQVCTGTIALHLEPGWMDRQTHTDRAQVVGNCSGEAKQNVIKSIGIPFSCPTSAAE